jgi:hypothetical protein
MYSNGGIISAGLVATSQITSVNHRHSRSPGVCASWCGELYGAVILTGELSNSAVVVFFVANTMYCSAYIVKDILWLRILTIAAGLLTLPYFLFQTTYSAVFWQSAFVLINLVHVVLLLLARRPIRLTEDQQILHDLVFRNFTSRETRSVLEIATWHTGVPNEVLIVNGQQEPVLYLLQHGRAEIIRDGQVVDWNGPGSFVGELRFITGAPAVADVVFTTEARYVSWNTVELKKLLEKNTALKTGFEALISANIATKLGNRGKFDEDNQFDGGKIRVA